MIVYDDNLKIFYSTLINDDRFFSGFGTKAQGDSRSVENVFNFFQNSVTGFKKIIIPEQIHSTNVAVFSSEKVDNIEKIPETDGVISKNSKTILTVITADCCPIVFVEKEKGIIGVSHQGWRGSVKRLGQKMVEKIVELGGKRENVLAAIGPSIGECCYIIDEDRYHQFVEEFDGYSRRIFHRHQGKLHLNLSFLNFLQIKDAGVLEKNIDFFPFCTRCDKKRFFSFRRDKKKDYGEMVSFIVKGV